MGYERWAKRMDDAVESSWLRGLSAQSRQAGRRRRPRTLPESQARTAARVAGLTERRTAVVDG